MVDLFKNSNPVSLPIQDSDDEFFVNHVYCVGRNYAAHAREMGADDRKPPFFFSKPNWAVAPNYSTIEYPMDTDNLNYEVELVIAVGEEKSIFGLGVGVDLTCRDIQGKAKDDGKPWFRGKCFQGSAPVSNIVLYEDEIFFDDLSLVLSVNGDMKQSGVCKDMIWNVGEIMCELAGDIPLQPGDLIFTGTPEGVGKLEKGNEVVAAIPGLVELSFKIS